MTDKTQKPPVAGSVAATEPKTTAPPLLLPASTTPAEPIINDDTDQDGIAVIRYLIIGLVGLIAVIGVGLIVAIIGAAVNSEGVGNFFRILRDFFIIVLALQGILIALALIILVLQVSALINLIRNEIKPIVDETRQTMSTIRGTAEFVSKNVSVPIIRTSAAITGAMAFMREVGKLRANIRPRLKK